MRELTLAKKLLWITVGSTFLTVLVLSGVLWWQMSSNSEALAKESENYIVAEVEQKLNANAAAYGEKIAGFINEAYRIPNSLAALLGDAANTQTLNRDTVVSINRSILEKNRFLSSIYSQFEANAFDGQDARFKQGYKHSVNGDGTLEVYITRDQNGIIEQQKVANAADKYLTSLNEFGIREAHWYLCAKDTLKPCIMEPYLYEIPSGDSVMLTSLTVPITKSGRFIGLAGVDLTLPTFQGLTEKLSSELYNGQAKVTLLSDIGLIVGSSHYKSKLGRPFKEAVSSNTYSELVKFKGQHGLFKTPSEYLVNYPINIKLANTQWSLLIEVPSNLALEGPNALAKNMSDSANQLGVVILITGAVIALIAFIIMKVVVGTVVAPLEQIQQRVDNLASSEGDLTHTLHVDTHAELIALAGGFNAFLAKLRGLIAELKDVSSQTKQQGEIAQHIAIDTKHNVQSQFQEIESVVTAMNEMSATALEVARASEQSAQQADEINGLVVSSESSLSSAMSQVKTMSEEIKEANQAVEKVASRSKDITQILDVIRTISEQTNLLALNAAIEAARAGEHGRGFAVVADEVRALASKTRSSTDDISQLIDSLLLEVGNASTVIEKGVVRAQSAVDETSVAFDALHSVVVKVDEITNQITHIATAAEEQSLVTEEINRNLTLISDAASQLADLSTQAGDSSEALNALVAQQDSELNKLKT
ncbi:MULTISPECIES: methyl-accepting chemotaxis protein [unclassified Pseudoalteromonas]|uniref:methyl-accepting chemotaxis protein n=1 Tax=unclassified Pseudoalteromonas TaxID=194690 RepID=UPI00110A631C|nr:MULTISPECIES: methyl-accepting chemotaxis protein [unclassified Pseudoalteromonas]MDC9565612.1 methyl-accepting chemotaxis protein [Pseudoalteromonas sp. GAB2316C]MDC9569977.1 methyl-accepting chemotaxis protein [Pseudoalteromonas sp. GABNB9D]MDC9574054.1 methyl-accepting chemotaxis protein [Pseudoalteromonas sp. GABNS16A]MDC9578417.1 methyl-accepting chemotaxis protein [Pseudoalteromonas sp. GABNS16E]MDC9586060.1 methyl-accepting chemotaxis protein [Pseudoalteromonas sp. GABNS16C]